MPRSKTACARRWSRRRLRAASAEAQLKAQDEKISQLESDLYEAQAQIEAAAANRLKMKNAEVAALESKLQALTADLQDAKAAAESAAAQLDDATRQLQEKDAEIESIESELRDKAAVIDSQDAELEEARQKLEEEPAIMRVHEPMGFYIDPYDTATEQRLLTAIACVGDMPAGYSPHVYYRISDQSGHRCAGEKRRISDRRRRQVQQR